MSNTPANDQGAAPAPKPEDATQTFVPASGAQSDTNSAASAPIEPTQSAATAAGDPNHPAEVGQPADASTPGVGSSPVAPFAANPAPATGAAQPSAGQQPGAAGAQNIGAMPPATTPNMASTPAPSVTATAVAGSAPNNAPAEVTPDGRPHGGVVLVNPDAAADSGPTETPGAKAAALIRQQIDIITMRIFYDAQETMRVGALPTDMVNLRTIVLTLANALEKNDRAGFFYTFSRVNLTISTQINDQVIPLHSGMLLSALIDGIFRDTINQGFKADTDTRDQSIALLDQMTDPAYQQLMRQPTYLEKPLAPRL